MAYTVLRKQDYLNAEKLAELRTDSFLPKDEEAWACAGIVARLLYEAQNNKTTWGSTQEILSWLKTADRPELLEQMRDAGILRKVSTDVYVIEGADRNLGWLRPPVKGGRVPPFIDDSVKPLITNEQTVSREVHESISRGPTGGSSTDVAEIAEKAFASVPPCWTCNGTGLIAGHRCGVCFKAGTEIHEDGGKKKPASTRRRDDSKDQITSEVSGNQKSAAPKKETKPKRSRRGEISKEIPEAPHETGLTSVEPRGLEKFTPRDEVKFKHRGCELRMTHDGNPKPGHYTGIWLGFYYGPKRLEGGSFNTETADLEKAKAFAIDLIERQYFADKPMKAKKAKKPKVDPVPTLDMVGGTLENIGTALREKHDEVEKERVKTRALNGMPSDAPPNIRLPGTTVWTAYKKAYLARHGVEPLRNAKVNSQCLVLSQQVGVDDAVLLVEYFLQRNDAFYVNAAHPIGLCLQQAQKLITEMKRGESMTLSQAQANEKHANTKKVITEYIADKGEVVDVEVQQ